MEPVYEIIFCCTRLLWLALKKKSNKKLFLEPDLSLTAPWWNIICLLFICNVGFDGSNFFFNEWSIFLTYYYGTTPNPSSCRGFYEDFGLKPFLGLKRIPSLTIYEGAQRIGWAIKFEMVLLECTCDIGYKYHHLIFNERYLGIWSNGNSSFQKASPLYEGCEFDPQNLQNIRVCKFILEFLSYISKNKKIK